MRPSYTHNITFVPFAFPSNRVNYVDASTSHTNGTTFYLIVLRQLGSPLQQPGYVQFANTATATTDHSIRSLIFPSGEISSTEVNASQIYWLYYRTRESYPIVTSGFLYGHVDKHVTNLWLPGFIRSIFS